MFPNNMLLLLVRLLCVVRSADGVAHSVKQASLPPASEVGRRGQNLRQGVKQQKEAALSGVSCGGHDAPTCTQCGPDAGWCNGDCMWSSNECVSKAIPLEAMSTAAVSTHDVLLQMGSRDDWHPFEGVGALSAGASSRLLRDYPAEQRREILDLLFKPKYGASLQVLKVEIGGDMQSTDGSEPSHMRWRNEKPDCTRGYETWLMKEAKARNPKIRIYGLAWGVPGWIGNGTYFTEDNVLYHVSWLKCIQDTYGFNVDYLGIWNEMPWGHLEYVDALARAIHTERLPAKLVLLDAVHSVDAGFLDTFNKNATFRSHISAVGMHYPCKGNDGLTKALASRKETRFWASEELSTVADWGGAGCWGRMINQNYVRMNATSSIAWSLVWSAYPNLECFGNGLLYAFQPWSGHYEVMPPVWTTAHTTQFSEVGWHYLPVGEGAGLLPEGGTYVVLVSDDLQDFTIVLETLQGQCFYGGGCFHDREASGTQRLRFNLGRAEKNSSKISLASIAARHGKLEVWRTNKSNWFEQDGGIHVSDDGSVTLDVPVDTVITLTTLRGASKQGLQRPFDQKGNVLLNRAREAASFPLPYRESFDEPLSERMPLFFADQGGAFEVVDSAGPDDHAAVNRSETNTSRLHQIRQNKVLEQQVVTAPIAWIGHSPEPLTLIGDVNWTDITAEVVAKLGMPAMPSGTRAPGTASPRHAGLCVRLSRYHFMGGAQATPEGYCLQISDLPQPQWALTAAGEALANGPLSGEAARRVLANEWLELSIRVVGANIHAWVDKHEVLNVKNTMLPFGQVALECGYHRCQFDNLSITGEQPPMRPQAAHRTLVRRAQLAQFDYHGRTCDPAPRLARRRRDFTGFAGFGFTPSRTLLVKGLGRLEVSGGHPWTRIHNVSLYSSKTMELLASVALPSEATNQVGIEETYDGWTFAALRDPIHLFPGVEYFIVSSELANGDAFYDRSVRVDADSDVEVSGPVYFDLAGWHRYLEPKQVYGPLNAWLEADPEITSAPLNKRLHDFGEGISKINSTNLTRAGAIHSPHVRGSATTQSPHARRAETPKPSEPPGVGTTQFPSLSTSGPSQGGTWIMKALKALAASDAELKSTGPDLKSVAAFTRRDASPVSLAHAPEADTVRLELPHSGAHARRALWISGWILFSALAFDWS